MIKKVVVTYSDDTVAEFDWTPAVPAVDAVGVDLTKIPTEPAVAPAQTDVPAAPADGAVNA